VTSLGGDSQFSLRFISAMLNNGKPQIDITRDEDHLSWAQRLLFLLLGGLLGAAVCGALYLAYLTSLSEAAGR